jgi:hypothetical protein
VQVGRVGAVVEEQQLARAVVHLGVRGHAPVGEGAAPGLLAERLRGARVEPVQVAALVEARQRDPAADEHVGAGRVLHPAAGAPAVLAQRRVGSFGQPRPQRPAGLLLGEEPLGADEPVAVERVPVPEADDVHHPVAVERVVVADRRVHGVLGVAQVHPVEVGRHRAGDDGQVVGPPLGGLRAPRPGPVGMVVVRREGGQQPADDLDVHDSPRGSQGAVTTNETVVAVLPPMLSVAAVRAPSTW